MRENKKTASNGEKVVMSNAGNLFSYIVHRLFLLQISAIKRNVGIKRTYADEIHSMFFFVIDNYKLIKCVNCSQIRF